MDVTEAALLVAAFVAAFVASFVGTMYYVAFAARRGIVAERNFRTLHANVVPRGGGIVFAAVFSVVVVVLWALGTLPAALMLAFGVGGGAAAAVGFADDVRDIKAPAKLAAQLGLAVWLVAVHYRSLQPPQANPAAMPLTLSLVPVALFIPVWMINLYNFVDGIDGMAITGAVYICGAALAALAVADGDRSLMLVTGLLAVAALGFVSVNLPPARAFMGDAGSIFLGYCFGALLVATVATGQISAWTWLAILGYYVGDTTTTTVFRVLMVPRWYRGHRSHAYQNLARILGSHGKVTGGVLLYDVLWALPLAVWSAARPGWAPLAAALSLGPVVLWTLRFGPRLSSD